MNGRQTRGRAFAHRGGGVRIAGTVIACDAAIGSELVFLSHAPAFGVHARRALPQLRGVRRQLLATELTLALLGPAGARLKAHALPAGYGRPFSLGDLRLEMFPSGFIPGAASLLCEHDGRRIVYAGAIGAWGAGELSSPRTIAGGFGNPARVPEKTVTADFVISDIGL